VAAGESNACRLNHRNYSVFQQDRPLVSGAVIETDRIPYWTAAELGRATRPAGCWIDAYRGFTATPSEAQDKQQYARYDHLLHYRPLIPFLSVRYTRQNPRASRFRSYNQDWKMCLKELRRLTSGGLLDQWSAPRFNRARALARRA